jgi:hypothetical protein
MPFGPIPSHSQALFSANSAINRNLDRMGALLAEFLALVHDLEGIVAGVERWICNHSISQLAGGM